MRRRLLLAAGPLLIVGLSVAAAATPGHDATADTISALAVPGQPMRLLVVTTLVAYGAVVVAATGEGLLRLHGAATIVTAIVPKVGPLTDSLANIVHVGAAVVAGAGLVAAMLVRRQHAWAAVAVSTAVVFRAAWGTPYYGGLERVLVLLAAVWLGLEVGDHGGEHLRNRCRIRGVVGGGVGGLGELPQHAEVGAVAVGDREQAHRTRRLALVGRRQLVQH